MPLDKASRPSFWRRFASTVPTTAGLCHTLRTSDQSNERGDDERKEQDDGAKDARLDHVALPVDGELARTVREPGEAGGDERHRDEEADQAQHLGSPYSCDLVGAVAGATSEALSCASTVESAPSTA